MKKKHWIPAALIILTVGIVAASFSGDKESPKEPANKPAAESEHEQTYKKTDEIPAHKDNEQDLNPEVMKETKQLAEQFVSLIAPLNPKQGADPLEKLRPIVTAEILKELSKNPARPTLTIYKRELLDIQTFPVDDILPDRKKWNVIAFVKTSDRQGNAQEEQVWYWVSVAKRAGEWKITGFQEGEGVN